MAGQMGIKIVNISVSPQETISLGFIRGFFSMNWISNAGYSSIPIIGFSNSTSYELMQSGYDNCAWFDDNNKLNVKSPATNSAMRLVGIIIDCNQ